MKRCKILMWGGCDAVTCQVSWDQRWRPVSRKLSLTICQASSTSPSLVTTSGPAWTTSCCGSTSGHVWREGGSRRAMAEGGKEKSKPKERAPERAPRRVFWTQVVQQRSLGLVGMGSWGLEITLAAVVEASVGSLSQTQQALILWNRNWNWNYKCWCSHSVVRYVNRRVLRGHFAWYQCTDGWITLLITNRRPSLLIDRSMACVNPIYTYNIFLLIM